MQTFEFDIQMLADRLANCTTLAEEANVLAGLDDSTIIQIQGLAGRIRDERRNDVGRRLVNELEELGAPMRLIPILFREVGARAPRESFRLYKQMLELHDVNYIAQVLLGSKIVPDAKNDETAELYAQGLRLVKIDTDRRYSLLCELAGVTCEYYELDTLLNVIRGIEICLEEMQGSPFLLGTGWTPTSGFRLHGTERSSWDRNASKIKNRVVEWCASAGGAKLWLLPFRQPLRPTPCFLLACLYFTPQSNSCADEPYWGRK